MNHIHDLPLNLMHYACTCPELFHNLLHLLSAEVGQLSTAQRETTHKLVLCDDTTSKLVMVSEELCRANAILVYHIPDFGKYLIQSEGGCFLQGRGGEGRGHHKYMYIRTTQDGYCCYV